MLLPCTNLRRNKRSRRLLRLGLLLPLLLGQVSQIRATTRLSPVEKERDGIVVRVGDKLLKLEAWGDDIIRVACAKDRTFFSHRSLAVEASAARVHPKWDWHSTADEAVLATKEVQAHVNLATGAVTFTDARGQTVLAEKPNGRMMTPVIVQGDQTYHVRQQWESDPAEALYGLGQQQLGLMNLKGHDLDLWQYNGTVAIPFMVSSKGYGVLWDNTSFTRFGDLRDWEPIPPDQMLDKEGKTGGFSVTYFTGNNFEHEVAHETANDISIAVAADAKSPNWAIQAELPATGPIGVRWEGAIQANETGDYQFETFSNYGIKLWVDGQLVISHWHQRWQPWKNVAKVRFQAGRRYHVKAEWVTESGGQILSLRWKTPSKENGTSLWSEVGEGTDYFFVYGPELEQVIAGYRQLTGRAPMMPRWAYGLWQCRQRYENQQQSLDVLAGFRSRRIPIDNIVQDWFYWKEDAWGSHEFDPARFPDPVGWIRDVHDRFHAHLMISVWPKFYPGTENFKAMRAQGYLYEPNLGEDIKDWLGHPDTFYDAFNPGARKLFWSQIRRELWSKGVDAWWLDASEPELLPVSTIEGQRAHVHPTGMGTGARMLNAYPLMNSAAVYEGQQEAAPNQRVFILTRSAFAGQQRYAAAVWSGDISSTWSAMRAQIPAGLGFCLSGLPYWTMDIGGFAVPARFAAQHPKPEDAEEWRELNTRWFEFGTFVPLLRVHGEFPHREMWEFGGESHPAYKAQLKFDRLRYRLLPYIYSLAGAVTHDNSTIMRALVMDFRSDPNVLNIGDEFMFGPAFLVSPVTDYQVRTRSVYLPRTEGGWYDFWSGKVQLSGQSVEAPAPYDAIPIHVKAGSIIPIGPDLQYASEKPTDTITVYIYRGANGEFTLYEDEGLDNKYEKGAFSRIPLSWNENTKTLTLGERKGSFKGMVRGRTFQIILVSKEQPRGFSFEPVPDRPVRYSGRKEVIQF